MKQYLTRDKKSISFTLIGIIILLICVSGYQYRQKLLYKNENRQLIIQNDSIMSVIIERSAKK